MRRVLLLTIAALLVTELAPTAQRTVKPPLHGRHWVAITGKPLGATAGAMIFQKGGNAVDAACAMLGAVATMWDTLGWGGETQALIYNPKTKKVVGINALGVAPTGATPEFYRQKGMQYPPEFGPLAAVTPGTPGGLMVMLAEFGTPQPRRRPRARDRDGRRLPDRGPGSRCHRARRRTKSRSGRTRRTVFLPARGSRSARRRTRAKSSSRPTSPPRCASSSTPSGRRSPPARTARKRSTPPTTASTAATSRRSSSAAHASSAGCTRSRTSTSWKVHVEEPVVTDYKGVAGLQAERLDPGPGAAADAEHPRERRRQVDGLQQREVHPRALPGDEPRVRRPRLLLRRHLRRAGGAREGPPLEGLRQGPREADRLGEERRQRQARRSLPVPGRHQPVLRLLHKWGTPAEREQPGQQNRAGDSLVRRGLHRRHDVDSGGRQGRMGRVGDAERRLDSGRHRRPHRHRA